MNEQAFNDAYQLFTGSGYTGSKDEFFNLISSNENAFDDAFRLFSQAGYNKSKKDFSNLLGVGKQLSQTDKPGQENWFDQTWFGRGFAAASTTGEATDLLMEGGLSGDFSNVDMKTIREFIEAKEGEAREHTPSKKMQRFQKQYEKEGKTWGAFYRGLKKDPVLMAELFVQSLGTQLGTFVDSPEARKATGIGAAGGAAAGSWMGWGAVGTGIAGAMGGLATSMESALTFGELIEERLKAKGKEFTDENIKALLEEEGEEIRNKAIGRGLTIGSIEALTGGIAGKTTTAVMGVGKTVGRTKKIMAASAGIGVEAVGGGLGEIGGRLAADQEMDPAEIGFEAITGTTTAPLTVGNALLSYKKPVYKLNGDDVTYAEMKKFVNEADDIDIAKASITMENDQTGLEAKAYKKQQAAIIDSQIDSKITNKKDRMKLVELDGKRRQAIVDTKKEGTQAVPDAEKKLQEIEDQISEIIGKYEGAIDKATTEEAAEVRKARRDITLQETIKFLQENKKFVGKDVIIAENDIDTKEAYDKAVAEYNAKVESGEIKGDKITEEYSSSDGFVVGDVIVVNKDVAGRSGQINVGAHELLHAILGKHMKSLLETDVDGNVIDDSKLRTFISDFRKTLTNDQRSYIFKEIERRNKAGENLNINTTEEWLTIFSDGITKGDITFAGETIGVKLRNFLQNIFRKFGYKKEFGSGAATYNFMKDYQKSIAAGGEISARAKRVAGGGTTAGDVKASRAAITDIVGYKGRGVSKRSDLIDVINDLQQGATTKADFQKPEVFNPVFESLQPGGAVNNYIRSLGMSPEKTQETIDAVIDRLINFDPAAKRKDGTVIGSRGLGEFIMANVGFGKKVAAKKLAIKGEKAKRETSIDTKEAKQLEDKPTTKTTKEGPKARKIKSLADVNINNKEIISASARAEIQALISKNPKNLRQEVEKIIDKEISKAIKKQMGKISNVKGEVVVSDEYKAFLALNYANIVQGLDVSTIKKNYNQLFELTEIGKEDKKTAKTDKPTLKKDSYYRKGIFKIETNKAKFTKFFTEGGYTTLLARQKALAKQIAQGIVEDTINNEIMNTSDNMEAVVKADIRNYVNSLNKQKKELKGNYSDQIKFSKSVDDQAAFLMKDVQNATYPSDVFNMKTKIPISKLDPNGNPWIPEAYEKVFLLVEDGKIIPKGVKNNVFRKLMDKLKFPTDKTIGDTFERWYYDAAERAGLIAKGFKLTESDIFVQSIGSFVGKMVQAPDLILEFVNSVGKKIQVGLEIKATGLTKMGHNKPFVKDPKNPDYKYKKNAGIKGDPKNPKFVNDKLEQAFDNVATKAEKLSKYLKKEFNVDWKSRQDFIPFYSEDGRPVYNDPVVQKLKAECNDGSVTIDGDFVAHHYNSKGVFYIQIADKGMFYLGSDPLNLAESLGITKFEGNFTLKGRLLVSPKTEGGKRIGRYASIDVEPVMDPRNITSKVGFSLDNPGSWATLKKALKKAPTTTQTKNIITKQKAVNFSRSAQNETKGISVLDFDDTLATTKSLVKFTAPDGTVGTLNAEEYALQYQDLLEQGYKFDFSEFNKVVDGKLAPLFQKALKLQNKFGAENMFVLTARPPAAAKAIFDFLKANGLNIPLKNITGLANSTSEAKALWVAEKVGEGFNDFYFADDALQNVQAVDNMLNQFDVKRKVQQAKVKFSKSMNDDFNIILEDLTGIEAKKRFSAVKARKRGAKKGRFRIFIPPSHEDFVGLLYNFMGKGEKGNKHRSFLEKALVRPLNRAYRELNAAKQSIANDYSNLNKRFKDVKKKLSKKTPDGDYKYEDAIRVYLWNKHGYDVPGLNASDQLMLSQLVEQDPRLKAYAENINTISKQEKYVNPTETWETGDIRMDLDDATGRVGREQFFAEFQENADIIFSEENLNKIEAAYGPEMVSALKDMLYRIKTGRNRPSGQNKIVNQFMNWFNGSVAATMFFNIRSAVLQQMSMVNFINFADNNIFKAAKAFANQKQYWSDWAFIFNSDFMKQRRGGIMTDVNGAELAETVKGAKNKVQALIKKLLQLGFLPTQIGDNIAIATGGATFYRNRVNTYLKQGLSKAEAEAKAWTDFEILAEATQQSARPDMISQQQASPLGKVLLAFQNVTSQFNRLGKKAFLDIKNRRITPGNKTQFQSDMSNASRIAYYFAIQNMIFYTLQNALFMMMFDDDKDDEEFLKKKERVINGSIDSVLRGSGVWGAVISTLKNMAIKRFEEDGKNWNANPYAVMAEGLQVSPPLGIKTRKLVQAERDLLWKKNVIDEMETFDIDNPQWSAWTSHTEGITNIPVNRMYNKVQNVRESLNNQHSALQRILMFCGWSKWNLGIKDEKIEKIKKKVKKDKKKKAKFGTKSKKKKLKVIRR